MFIIIVFDRVLTRSSPVSLQDFYCSIPMWSVTGCDSSLRSFCYFSVCFLSRMHLHLGYYYYNYVVIGVLRPLRLIYHSLLNRVCSVLWGSTPKIIIIMLVFRQYLYLIFSDDSLLSLDEWVFNTEAHPIPVRGRNAYYRAAAVKG